MLQENKVPKQNKQGKICTGKFCLEFMTNTNILKTSKDNLRVEQKTQIDTELIKTDM